MVLNLSISSASPIGLSLYNSSIIILSWSLNDRVYITSYEYAPQQLNARNVWDSFLFLKTKQQKALPTTKRLCNSIAGFCDVLVAKYLTTGSLSLVWTQILVDIFIFISEVYDSEIIKLCFGTSLVCSVTDVSIFFTELENSFEY